MQILGSLEKPSSGEIYINNQNLSELNEKELAIFRNKNIGFIFQFHHQTENHQHSHLQSLTSACHAIHLSCITMPHLLQFMVQICI